MRSDLRIHDLSKGTPNADKDDDPRKAWHDSITSFSGHDKVADAAFQRSPNKAIVEKFVNDALDACLPFKPVAISVPQLPHVDDSGRNKLNRALAEAAA